MSSALARTTYSQLVKDISTLYEDARKGQVRFAWETGRRIVEVEQDGDIRAAYGAGLIRALASDLTAAYGPGSGFSETNLKCMRQLYRLNPKGPEKSPHADLLTWSDQRELMTVRDVKVRQRLVKRIAGKGLSRDELRALVHQETGRNGKSVILRSPKGDEGPPNTSGVVKPLPPLVRPTDLKLGTYKQADLGQRKEESGERGKTISSVRSGAINPSPLTSLLSPLTSLDLGFFVIHPLSAPDLKTVTVTDTPSYTYAAVIERVVDGDTLCVVIEVGFDIFVREKLRLRGVNTPELGSPEGEKAKKFVEKLLPVGATIILKSHKCGTDTYGRFVADVFLKDPSKTLPRSPGDQRRAGTKGVSSAAEEIIAGGEYLNQVLLDKGYAVRMAE